MFDADFTLVDFDGEVNIECIKDDIYRIALRHEKTDEVLAIATIRMSKLVFTDAFIECLLKGEVPYQREGRLYVNV